MAGAKTNITEKKFKLTFFPFKMSIDVQGGSTILEAVRQLQLPLKASCGGKGSCGDCLIKILAGNYKVKASAALCPIVLFLKNGKCTFFFDFILFLV